jgi:hypothetical protein
VPHGRPTPRPLTLHIQLPALVRGIVPCSCDGGERTKRLAGQGFRNTHAAGGVGTGRPARHLLPLAAPRQRLRQESQLSCLSLDSNVAPMNRRAMATIPAWLSK